MIEGMSEDDAMSLAAAAVVGEAHLALELERLGLSEQLESLDDARRLRRRLLDEVEKARRGGGEVHRNPGFRYTVDIPSIYRRGTVAQVPRATRATTVWIRPRSGSIGSVGAREEHRNRPLRCGSSVVRMWSRSGSVGPVSLPL
jgi:hypothetical protein